MNRWKEQAVILGWILMFCFKYYRSAKCLLIFVLALRKYEIWIEERIT